MEPKIEKEPVKFNRAQRRAAKKEIQKEWTRMKYSANMSDQQFRYLITKILRGEVSIQEWEKMSKGLQKRVNDVLGEAVQKIKENPELLKGLPANAIVKDIKFDEEEQAPVEDTQEKVDTEENK